MFGIWLALVLAAAVASGGGWFGVPAISADSLPTAKPVLVHYRAVLVAGDGSIPNFDNAALTLANRLDRSGADSAVLTSDSKLVNGWRNYATAWRIDEFLAGVKPGDACLVFVTSHGNEFGLRMAMDNAERYFLTPTRLANILTHDCGDKPTVAILSGCHSGTFVTPVMEAENRIILTAARRDRTSFGCSADYAFTYFDECLLESLADAGTWAAIFDRTKACVDAKERAKWFVTPSLPQGYFGAAVRDLGVE